ncbi:uncharacterized protein LOC142340412 [Convolutriloba macropyga]|uniref:uncharacterized protein LOC142340412 n=1 Tax=Convolutriloba macropyga TaxID=536237 RepID=UPI003F51D32F
MTVKLDNVVNNLFQERTRWSQRKREPKRSSFYKTAAKRRNKGLSSDDSSEENDPDDSNDPDGNEKEKKKKKSGAEDEKEDDSDDETSSDAYENILEASMEDLKQMQETEIHEAIRLGALKSRTRLRPEMFSETFQLKVGKLLADGCNLKMQETEIHEAIRLGALKSRTRLRPEMFSETFQLKVGKLLADGCNLKALSDKLDLSPDTLRSWRRLHEQKVVELKQRLNDKKKKKKKYREQRTRERTVSQNSSLTKEILEQVKQISVMPSSGPRQLQKILPRSSEDQNDASNSQSQFTSSVPAFHSGQSPLRGGKRGIAPPSPGGMIKQLIHTVSSSGKHMFTTAAPPSIEPIEKQNALEGKQLKGQSRAKIKSKPETNVIENIHILDKGASDVSTDESDYDDDVIPKPVMQDSLPFLCNDCREIFRNSSLLQTHLFKCPSRNTTLMGF